MNKKSNKFQYPHPLVKNLHQNKVYTPENINEMLNQRPNFYDNNYVFSPSIKNYISPKLLRLSNSKIIPQQKFGVLMQPFNARQQVEFISRNSVELQHFKCQQCKGFLSNQCQSTSLYEIKCKICEKIQSISPQVKNSLENIPRCYDIGEFDVDQTLKVNEKNICFVIQASEFNYNYRVHEVIQSCLKSLQSTLQANDVYNKQSQLQTEDEDKSVRSNTNIEYQSTNQTVHYNISFIFFNNKNIFIINQSTNEVMVFNQSFISEDEVVTESLIGFDEFFRPISDISQETFTLIQEILYDSYLKNTSCLDVTTQFIHKYIDRFMSDYQRNSLNQNLKEQKNRNKRQVEYKFFVNSLRFTKKVEQIKEKQKNNGILQNISNTFSSNLHFSNKRILDEQKRQETTLSQLNLCSNFEFFYLPQSCECNVFISQKQVVRKLNNNLYKMYPQTDDKCKKGSNNFFNQLYYDLFENLSTQKYFDIKITITTSQHLEVIGVGNQALGYNDCSSQLKKIHSSHQTGQKFNTYEIVLNCLEPNNTLPIDLKIAKPSSSFNAKKQSGSQTIHFMEINFQYSKSFIDFQNKPYNQNFTRVFHVEVASLNRAINVIERIYSSLSTYVDDQVLFYFYLRWILIECHKTKTNHTVLKRLYQQIEKIADQFKDSYGHIDFHKEYVRIFLYSFMITNRALVNGINENFYYERHQWIKNSMQCLSKSLYSRTYSIFKNKETNQVDIKNVKTAPKNFRSDSLLLLDNGKNIYMIIGEDNSVEDLKKIFGTCFMHEIQQMTELPQLESNIRYRQMIDLARSQHESNFLPLKIIELFSHQFDSEISHYLYIKDNHYKFMKKLWDMESAHKIRT